MLLVLRNAGSIAGPWVTSKGFNFRATPDFVSDLTDQTYVVGNTYPTTRLIGGQLVTFGWEALGADPLRDRSSASPYAPEASGINSQVVGSPAEGIFRVDLPNTGAYQFHLGVTDSSFGNKAYFGLRDSTTEWHSIAETSVAQGGPTSDVAGVVHSTLFDWRAQSNRVSRNYTSTIFRLALKVPTANASGISHLTITPITGPYLANAKTAVPPASVTSQASPACDTLSGSTLVATMQSRLSTLGTFSSITDTYGNTWVQHPNSPQSQGDSYQYLYYCVNAVGGTGHQVTFASTGASVKSVTLAEIRGTSGNPVAISGATDSSGLSHAAGMTGLTTGGLIVASVGGNADSGSGFFYPNTGWTKYAAFEGSNAWCNALLAKNATGSADILGFGTGWSTGTKMLWLEFLPAPVGGTTTPLSLTFTALGSPALARTISKSFSASTAASLTITRSTSKSFSQTGTGSPALTRSISKSFSTTATGTPSFLKGLALKVSAAVTAIGTPALTKGLAFKVSAAATATGTAALAAKLLVTRASSVTATGTVTLAKQIGKFFSVAASGTPALARRASKSFAVTAVGTLTLNAVKQGGQILQSFSAAATATVALIKTIYRSASVTAAGTVSLTKSSVFRMAASVVATGTVLLVKRIALGAFTAVATGTATLARRISVVRSVVLTGTPVAIAGLVSKVTKAFTGTGTATSTQSFQAKPDLPLVIRLKIRNLMRTIVRSIRK